MPANGRTNGSVKRRTINTIGCHGSAWNSEKSSRTNSTMQKKMTMPSETWRTTLSTAAPGDTAPLTSSEWTTCWST